MHESILKDFEEKYEKFKKEFEQTDFNSKGLIIDGKFRKIEKILGIRKEWTKFCIVCKIKGKPYTYEECLEDFTYEKDYKQTLFKKKKEKIETLKKYIKDYTEKLQQLEKELENVRTS